MGHTQDRIFSLPPASSLSLQRILFQPGILFSMSPESLRIASAGPVANLPSSIERHLPFEVQERIIEMAVDYALGHSSKADALGESPQTSQEPSDVHCSSMLFLLRVYFPRSEVQSSHVIQSIPGCQGDSTLS